MGKLPAGMLNISRRAHSSRYQIQQPQAADQRQSQEQHDEYRQEFTESTVRERIANKWNDLKMFCWRRGESMQLERA